MNTSRPSLKRIGLVLFSIGALLAFVLTALMIWADIEAITYGFPRLGKTPLRGLSCPPFMNSSEIAHFSLTLENPTESVQRPQAQVMISTPGLSRWRTLTTPMVINPGESATATWDTSADDIVLRQFVLVKAHTFASYPLPDMEGTCGIFVVNLPQIQITGNVLYWLWLGVSLVILLVGLWLRDFWNADPEQKGGKGFARKVIAGLSVLGMIVGSLGWWVVGIVILLVVALALPAMFIWGTNS